MANFFRPFSTAMGGVVYAFKTQRHMRFHLYAVVIIIALGLWMDLRLRELIVLLFVISFVVVAEMFNSAIEAVVDLVHPGYHPLAKFAKDMAAGGVLITSLTALVVGLLLLLGDGRWHEIRLHLASPDPQTQAVPRLIIGAFILFALVVIFKGLGAKGQVLRGGFASGHAAFASYLAVYAALVIGQLLPAVIVILLAAMVAQARWEARIHSMFELGFGALLGTILALVLFGVLPR